MQKYKNQNITIFLKVENLNYSVQQLPYFFGNYKLEFFCFFFLFFLPLQSQKSRSILEDGSRSLGLQRKGKLVL